jgi:hypothetical protein
VKLRLWTTGNGQEKFRSFEMNVYRGADIGFFLFSTKYSDQQDKARSFDHATFLAQEAQEKTQTDENTMPAILVGMNQWNPYLYYRNENIAIYDWNESDVNKAKQQCAEMGFELVFLDVNDPKSIIPVIRRFMNRLKKKL